MDEDYDCIILGTGLTECILSALMAIFGKRVLHIDKNSFYGGKFASLSPLQTVFDTFGITKDLSKFERGKNWNVDLISKFLMASEKMVTLLINTDVIKYLEFKHVEGSYIYVNGQIEKVPSDEAEALSSDLMDLFEKRRFRKFLTWVMKVDADDPSTWNSLYSPPLDIRKDTIEHAFNAFQLAEDTQNFIGHAMCLYQNDSYRQDVPAVKVIEGIRLYSTSFLRYGKSPYIYPLYGLSELSQAFARLSAVHGGTFILSAPFTEIVSEDEKVIGVRFGDSTARCSFVVCDPTYAPSKVKKSGQVVRAICILNHPIEGLRTPLSAQIIIPQYVTQRKHDIYISCVSHPHLVCPEGFYLVHIVTTVETDDPHAELKPALDVLGVIEQTFYLVDDLYEPMDDGTQSGLYISCSYDATTHFQSIFADVENLYSRIMGTSLDLDEVKRVIAQYTESNQFE